MAKKLFTLVLVFALFPILITAQMGQTGSIRGIVATPDGVGMPGVSVTLKSPALVISEMTTVSNEFGQYRFLSLAPGKYELTFSHGDMNTIVRKGIVVNANLNVTVNINMQLKSVEEFVVVEGKAPTVDRQSVTGTATLDEEFLESIPASRNLSTYFNMTPGVSGDSAQGATVRDNSYNLDGVRMNDPVVGTYGTSFSMEIMEEISVQTGGLSAEHGSVKGAVVNVLTKSGGNRFSGSVNAYYKHESLKSDNTKGTPLEGYTTGAKYELEPGITLGGPVIKDKLWFFTNFSAFRSEYYSAGFPYNKESELAIKDGSMYPYIKLTYQPDQNNKFVASFNYNYRNIDHDGASRYQTEETTTEYKSPTYVFSAHWTRTFGSNLVTNLKIGTYSTELNWTVKNQDANYYDAATWLNSNSYGWDDLNPRKRLQINFDGTLFLDNLAGSHEMKFGIQTTFGQGRRVVKTYGEPDEMGIPRVWNTLWNGELYYSEWFAGHDRKTSVFNMGIFVNDVWNISKNLTLNLGLRYDNSASLIPKHGADVSEAAKGDFGYIGYPDVSWDMTVPETRTAFRWQNLSPRLGLIYDIFSDGTTLIKANYARLLQDNYTSISFELHPVNWVGYGAYVYPDGSLWAIDYVWVPGVNTQVGYKDHDLKAPYTTEISFGIERELWEDTSLSVRYTRRWDRNLIEDVDASALDIDALMEDGELVWTNYTPVEVVDPYDGSTATFWDRNQYLPAEKYIVNPPGAKRDYNGLEVVFNKRYADGWSLNASYVYSKSTGLIGTRFWDSEGRTGFYNNPNAHVNAYGRMPLERRHQFKLQGLLKGPWGVNLSGYFRYLSGRRYTRTISSLDLGVALSTDATVNAEPRGSYGLPDLAILDLRVEKNFHFGKTVMFKVFCDIFNALNNNKATSVVGRSSSDYQVFQEMTGIYSPRIFRFGAKIEF
jgi:hypothetical protein